MSNTNQFYIIRNISNLHVGSGENNYGVVDNLVQKDINTGLPTIHSSSLKGALRKYFEHKLGLTDAKVKGIFGDNDHAGNWQFLAADMLSRPLRSDKTPYVNATSPNQLKAFAQKLSDLGKTVPKGITALSKMTVEATKPVAINTETLKGAIIEEMDWIIEEVKTVDLDPVTQDLLGEHIVLLNSQDLQEVELPFIARNNLGDNPNLWYEEVVPYDCRFVFGLIHNNAYESDFTEELSKGNVQIGANASIGYGICKISKLTL